MTGSTAPYVSQPDSEHFGIPVARVQGAREEEIPGIVEWCARNDVRLLIARSGRIEAVHAMEEDGFRLMDVLVYYHFLFDRKPIPLREGSVSVRQCHMPEDLEQIVEIASASFTGYAGHYHNDPRLPKDRCAEGYADWARNSCLDRSVAQEVFVAEVDGRVVAFATVRLREPSVAEGSLVAVAPEAQRRGTYRELLIARLQWCRDQGISKMIASTQVNNYAVQKVLQRVGFEMYDSLYTLHRWFD